MHLNSIHEYFCDNWCLSLSQCRNSILEMAVLHFFVFSDLLSSVLGKVTFQNPATNNQYYKSTPKTDIHVKDSCRLTSLKTPPPPLSVLPNTFT